MASLTLKIFDLLGREVATLVNEKKDAGTYSENVGAVSSTVLVLKMA